MIRIAFDTLIFKVDKSKLCVSNAADKLINI